MGIKRYISDADTTITNAFESNLVTRGTGSNMGESDVTEVFSIYGQASGSTGYSPELSRALYKFPTSTISSDRTAGTIPATGSVEFYLNLYNVKHAFNLPRDYTLVVSAVSQSWEEGYGLDMEGYSDLTHDGVGANWENAASGSKWGDVQATATITALSKTAGQANTRVLTVTDVEGNAVSFTIDNSLTTSTATKIAFGNANSNATQFATNIAAAINAADTADTLNISATSDSATVTLTMTTASDSSATSIAGTAVTDSVVTVVDPGWLNGAAATIGGKFHDSPVYIGSFDRGYEDLNVDITGLVEEWIAGTKTNHGLAVYLTSSQEAYFSSSTGANTSELLHNTAGAQKSYYTKKFFARGTEFFFKRPCIEARWDSTDKDDRGNFFYSSSLAPGEDNLNTLYLYNVVRGQLQDIPAIGTGPIYVSLYSGSADNSSPSGSALQLVSDKNYVSAVNNQVVTGAHVSTGIYTASFALTSALTPLTTLFDVWYTDGHTAKGTAATAKITALSKTAGQANTRTLLVTDAEGNAVTFTIDNSTSTSTATVIAFSNANSNANQYATNIAAAINAANTAGTLNITASASSAVVTLTMKTLGTVGNSVANISGTAVDDSALTITNQFTGGEDPTQFHTGSVSPTTLDSLNIANTPRYTTKITNLKDSYGDQENVRFRIYTRDRNWNPNIYKVASREVQNLIVEDAYYKVLRVTDSEEVIGYGTGSTPGATGSASDYTRLSFDVSGSYFDLDMTLLESGYAYGVKFVYFVNGKYLEQPETFKFRVE